MALRRAILQVAVLAAALLALLPAVAMADPTWLGAETRDATGERPDVTTDADGNSAAVWIGSGGEVNAAVRPAGGPWGAPENLEPAGQVQTEDAPHVIAEPDGELVAVWVGDFSGISGNYIRWAHKPLGGDWSAPANIDQANGNAGLLDLEVGASGDVTVLWTQGTVTATPRTTTKPSGSDIWESSDPVPNAPGANLALAVAPDGSAVIAFADQCDSFYPSCVLAEYRPRGGDWSSPDPELAASALGEVTGVAVAAREDSSYTVAWGEGAAPLGRVRSQAPPGAVRSADRASGLLGSWAGPQAVAVLPDAAAGCRSSRLGCIDLASRDNTLAAVWQQGDGATGEIAASTRTDEGPWSAVPETVGDPGTGDAAPQAALTAGHVTVAAWLVGNGSTGAVVRGAHRNSDGSWDPQDLGVPSQGEGSLTLGDVVADGEGDAVAAWRDPDGARAAGFDGTGPRISARFPSGRQGDALPFSAAAEDNWSGVAGISWVFGDGGTADEPSPSHTYANEGSFTATATATDGVGNETPAQSTVNVAPRDEPPPTPTPTPDPCGTTDRDRDGIKDACDTNDGSEPPVAFKTVNATVVSGDVFVKLPAGAARASQRAKPPKGFVRLEGANTIPVGSTLDTAKGRVRLRSASDTRKHTQKGEFFRGRFVIRQVRKPRGRAKRRSTKLITVLTLTGSSFSKTCRARPKASTAARRRSRKRVRRLFGDGKGRFRTSGRNAAATVRGTRWSVQDRCDGTLVTVQRGRVSVRDLVRRRTVVVRTGHTYLARRR